MPCPCVQTSLWRPFAVAVHYLNRAGFCVRQFYVLRFMYVISAPPLRCTRNHHSWVLIVSCKIMSVTPVSTKRRKIVRFGPTLAYHRLNGSSSPVLTATSLSYGESKNSTPAESKPLTRLKQKFGTVDYIGGKKRHAKFYANPYKGGFSANG